ncbi:MAG: DUF4783 domain-containing protein [Bacteroidetes bacterium]|nr:DUF4783 domain-containing protein [Bacteroidota bacterium]
MALPLFIFATATGDLDNISAAIKAGNSKALAEYFDNTVEVKIANKEGAYSKARQKRSLKTSLLKIRLKHLNLFTMDLQVVIMPIMPLVH